MSVWKLILSSGDTTNPFYLSFCLLVDLYDLI